MGERRRTSPVEPVTISPLSCSIDEQRRRLGQAPFFRGLGDADLEEVLAVFAPRHYPDSAPIHHAGAEATRLSVIAAGMVKLARPTRDGQDVVLDILGPGESFGSLAELGDAAHRETATAHTQCCILSTTSGAFHRILTHYPAVALAALEIVAGRLRESHDTIEQVSAYPVEHRVAATLLKLADRAGTPEGAGILIEMPLSRQDLADMTGATVETVSRVMSEFRRAGLVESGRRWIAIRDRDGLAAIAG
jgi:CRP-like cAMP-binding protein